MRATEALKEDHRVIERMLRVLFVASQQLQRGEEVDPQIFSKALDFIQNFSDKCHHHKEEDNLFPTLQQRGVPKEGGPIGMMLVEHDEGRQHVREFASALDKYEKGDRSPAVKNGIISHVMSFVQLLSQHIDKEDNILYAIADDVLSAADQADLVHRFHEIEENTIGPGTHERYVKMVDDLERAVQRQSSRT
ncbi:MAG: hemerythrin domain-containing protein [Chloroflexi bacterium]|nr:hemerythrin domain-containing protein [Chloroflexota bacterium]